MKKNLTTFSALLIAAMLTIVSCSNRDSSNNLITQVNEENSIFPRGEPNSLSYLQARYSFIGWSSMGSFMERQGREKAVSALFFYPMQTKKSATLFL